MLAVIGGDPRPFRPLVDSYGEAHARRGHAERLVGVHSPGHVADTDQEAADQYWPYYRDFLPEARARRGMRTPTWREFQEATGPR